MTGETKTWRKAPHFQERNTPRGTMRKQGGLGNQLNRQGEKNKPGNPTKPRTKTKRAGLSKKGGSY